MTSSSSSNPVSPVKICRFKANWPSLMLLTRAKFVNDKPDPKFWLP